MIINECEKENELKLKIMQTLQYLGYSPKHQGTHYLSDAILEIHQSPDPLFFNLIKDVYPTIAKKYNKTVNNVKSSINKSTENMYYECDIEKLKNFFHFCCDTKPTVKTVIFAVLNILTVES